MANSFRGARNNMPMGNVMQGRCLILTHLHASLVVVKHTVLQLSPNSVFWAV
jgi:hypothetical protein